MNPHPDTLLPPIAAPPTPRSEVASEAAPRHPPESGRKRRAPEADERGAEAPGGAGPLPVSDPSSSGSVIDEPFKVQKERLIDAFERHYLRELMTWAGGNVSRAARKAKIDRMYLHRLLARHGILRDSLRDPERTYTGDHSDGS